MYYTVLELTQENVEGGRNLKNAKGKFVDLDTKKLDREKIDELDEYIDSLEDQKGSLIHILHKGQSLFGYLPENLQIYISRKIDIPAAKVNGVVSFYSFFTQEPRGKHTISICMGTACFVNGSDKIFNELKRELNVENNKMTEDGLFTLKDIRCVGACGLAPVVMVDDQVYGHVKVSDVSEIIKKYREED
ncbi:MAG: NAD(P)H-dependent oxidoreductase subunit E [Clostridiales bacterium]|nr:NAD(P)H-dependent oxidoreductase subunit E [Clostridiales bacterium]